MAKNEMEGYNNYPIELVDTSYDVKLMDIKHYKNHPEMLPYIGLNYSKFRLLLVGESHYINKKYNECKCKTEYDADDNMFMNKWYSNDWKDIFLEGSKALWWFSTRMVVCKNLLGKRSRASSIYFNPADVIKNRYKLHTKVDALSSVAFMNYFQRPATVGGTSISTFEKDREISKAVFEKVYKILKPELVIFTSKKAYIAFANSEVEQDNIKYTMHPCSKYWEKSEDQGKNHFDALIRQYKYDKTDAISIEYIEADFMRNYLNDIYDKLKADGFTVSKEEDYYDRIKEYYLEEKDTYPGFTIAKASKRYKVEIKWRLYLINYNNQNEWWYLPGKNRTQSEAIDFRHLYDTYVADNREDTIVHIVEAIKNLV